MGIAFSSLLRVENHEPSQLDYTPPPANFPFPTETRTPLVGIFSVGYSFFETHTNGANLMYQAAKSADMAKSLSPPPPVISLPFPYHAASEIVSIPLHPQNNVADTEINTILMEKLQMKSVIIRPMIQAKNFIAKRHAEYFRFDYIMPLEIIPFDLEFILPVLEIVSNQYPSLYAYFFLSNQFTINGNKYAKWTLQGNAQRAANILEMIGKVLARLHGVRIDLQVPSIGVILMDVGFPRYKNRCSKSIEPISDVEFNQLKGEIEKWTVDVLYSQIDEYIQTHHPFDHLKHQLRLTS